MNKRSWAMLAIVVLLLVAVGVLNAGCQAKQGPELGSISGPNVTNFNNLGVDGWAKVAAPTTQATATPGFVVKMAGLGNAFEIRNALETPVAYCDKTGACTFAGTLTSAGAVNGGGVLGASLAVAPTAQATATAAFYINSATGNTGDLQDWRINNVNVQSMNADGSFTSPFHVNVGAAATTATPAAVVDSAGAGNVFSVRAATTPVFRVNAAGVVSSTIRMQVNYLDVNPGGGTTAVVALTPIAPTASLMQLTSAGAVDPGGIAAGTVIGQLLILEQTSAQNITLTEAGTLHLGAATRVLNALDTVVLMWTGAAWVEIAYTDN